MKGIIRELWPVPAVESEVVVFNIERNLSGCIISKTHVDRKKMRKRWVLANAEAANEIVNAIVSKCEGN